MLDAGLTRCRFPEENEMASKAGKNDRTRNAGKIQDLGPGGAEVVRKATDVLESELATGLEAARRAQKRFRAEKKVDLADLQDALSRFREDGHQVVDLARNLTDELRSEATGELTQRLFKDAHDALDLALGLVEMAPDLINRVAQMAGGSKPTEKPPRRNGRKTTVVKERPTARAQAKKGA